MKKVLFLLLLVSLSFQPAIYAGDHSPLATSGDVIQIALPVSAALITLMQKDKVGFLQMAGSFAATLATTYILKYAVNRRRPNGGCHSFPSGHTAMSFSSAAFLQRRYGTAYGVPAFLLATYVGITRVETKWHWASDVLAGAVIGTALTWWITKPLQKKHINVSAYVVKDGGGVELSTSFV